MDPAVYFSVIPSFVERARVPLPPVRIDPVDDPVDPGQVIRSKAFCGFPGPAGKPDEDMAEDILPVHGNPWDKVVGNPLLVPSPFLAAFPALPAVLGHRYVTPLLSILKG